MSRLKAAWQCLMGKPTVYRMIFLSTLKTPADCIYRVFDSTIYCVPSEDVEVIYANG